MSGAGRCSLNGALGRFWFAVASDPALDDINRFVAGDFGDDGDFISVVFFVMADTGPLVEVRGRLGLRVLPTPVEERLTAMVGSDESGDDELDERGL